MNNERWVPYTYALKFGHFEYEVGWLLCDAAKGNFKPTLALGTQQNFSCCR